MKVYTNCTNSGPISVYVDKGKVVRVRPLVAEDKDFKPWTIDADGHRYTPEKKFNLGPYVLTERNRLYSKDRILTPMKRVDWDPNGQRNQHNRGKSGYEPINWDEALKLVSGEIKRVQTTWGKGALTAMTSSHHNWGLVGYKISSFKRFFNLIGYTEIFDNPDSWEGWIWGSAHTYGFYWRLGMPEPYDMLEDGLKHAEQVIYWSNDPETTRGVYTGQDSAMWRRWLREKGVKQVVIDPYHNSTAGPMNAKWIAPRIGTDAALALGIAYVWIKEGTYDKKYIADRTVGFEKFEAYVLGKEDGVPKTPGWAAEESGVPLRTIVALARDWAKYRTMLGAGARGGEGGACRQAYATEWARLMVLLQAMQGLGKPGRGLWGTAMGAPWNANVYFPGYGDRDGQIAHTRAAKNNPMNPVTQKLYRLLLPEAVMTGKTSWTGESFPNKSLEQQFKPFVYPMEGHPQVKMFYRYGGSFPGTMTDTSQWARMYQSPGLETVVNQDVWWSSETPYADIILPACTQLEREDIGEWGEPGGQTKGGSSGCNYRIIVRMQKAIEPLGESKSDYQIFTDLAERLGVKEEYTEGNSDVDWARKIFEISDLPKFISWEEFNRKGYYMIPLPDDYKSTPSLRWYAEGRACDTPDPNNPKRGTDKGHELGTYTGKIEFESQSLKKFDANDAERPPLPHYIPSWEGHRSEGAKEFPIQLLTPHPRFSFHTHYDKHAAWLDEIPGHRIQKDGYAWWPVRIHPSDAATRGIKDRDIVKLYNKRATVLCIAVVTERVRPGVVQAFSCSAKYDLLEPGNPDSPDRGGCVNLLTPRRMTSKNAPGMAALSCLIQVAKWTGK